MPSSQSENLSFPTAILSPAHAKKSSVFFLTMIINPFLLKVHKQTIHTNNSNCKNLFIPHRFLIFSLKLSIFQIESIIFAVDKLHLGKTVGQVLVFALDLHYILLTLKRFYLW